MSLFRAPRVLFHRFRAFRRYTAVAVFACSPLLAQVAQPPSQQLPAQPEAAQPASAGASTPQALQSGQPTSFAGAIRGNVTDPDGAFIPGATVTLSPASGKPYTVQSGSDGSYTLRGVPNGVYNLTVTMPGFASYVRQGVRVTGTSLTLNAKLAIQDQQTVVNVQADQGVSVDPDNNASVTVIKGKDLDALSDDPDELQSELTALAGPAAGPNGGQIYIDGFTGGQLPPKSSIREIRINQNPFSAQYDKIGYGRIEIFTKPGTDKLHGFFSVQGNDSVLNTSTPFLGSADTQPNYYTSFILGNFSGPLGKRASFTIGGSHRSIQVNTLINPVGFYSNSATSTTLCAPGDLTCTNYGSYPEIDRAIPYPQLRSDISPRIDFAVTDKNTLTVRYQYEQASALNSGLGTLNLPANALNTSSNENTIQISDSQIFSDKIINEVRFEYQRDTSNSLPVSTAPQVAVQGYFNGGGSANQINNSTGSHIELQNYTSVALAKNFIRFGGRLRTTSELLTSNSGSNGTFTYTYLLDPCYSGNGATLAGCNSNYTNTLCAQQNLSANNGHYYSSYQCGLASQYSITRIANQHIGSRETDVGLYAEDDWKIRPNLTFSYGLRLEAQNNINSAHDFAPRLSLSYGIPRAGGKAPVTVLRAGYGIFYDRFALSDTLTTLRLNGINQVQSTYNYPNLNGAVCNPSNTSGCTSGTASTGITTTYTSAAGLRSQYNLQTAFGVDQSLGKIGKISINYLNTRGDHMYLSRAYTIPSTTGVTSAYNYQFDSGGNFKENQLIVNGQVNHGRVSLFGFYQLGFANSNTTGADGFLTSVNATAIDYGRASFVRRNFGVIGGNITLPYKISFAPFLDANSGSPYNITTGVDNNGDSLFNDRPSFAPGHTDASSCFDASAFTAPNATTGTTASSIPINYCTGPANVAFNLRLGRTWGFGPLTEAAAARQHGGGGNGGPGGFGGGGRRGGGPGGPFGGGTNTGHKYNFTLGAQAFNLANFIPYAAPISQLSSTRFGQFYQLASGGPGGPSGTAVRRFFLQATLQF